MFIEKALPAGERVTEEQTKCNVSHQLLLKYNYFKTCTKYCSASKNTSICLFMLTNISLTSHMAVETQKQIWQLSPFE